MKQIHKRLAQKQPVPFDANAFVAGNIEALILLFQQHFKQLRGFPRQFHHLKHGRMKLQLPRIGSRHGEQAVDQTGQPIHLFQHAADHFPVVFPRSIRLQPHFAYAANRRQGSAQFMGSIGGESPAIVQSSDPGARASN